MLHAAPTSETKADTAQSKTQVVPQPERELHPHLLSAAGRYSSSGTSGVASSDSRDAQRRQTLAGMQSTRGNQAVLRMLHSPQQAARMTSLRPSQGIMLQRKCACGGSAETEGECEECKAKREGALQRSIGNQGASPAATTVPPIVHDVLSSSGQPLDAGTQGFMEPRFGRDFSQVRVHTDARAAESARAVNALAYTVGKDVVFGAGQYAPGTSEGRRLMAHELTHVVQQNGVPQSLLKMGQPGDTCEQEADHIAERVIQVQTNSQASNLWQHAPVAPVSTTPPGVIRRKSDSEALPVPEWGQLPPDAQNDLASREYDEEWFRSHPPDIRLTVLNLYVKLQGLHLWRFVGMESGTELGQMDFICPDIKGFKEELRNREDFTSIATHGNETWSYGERQSRGQLHFKQFENWPETKVRAHIDPYGSVLRSKWWLIPVVPITQLIIHGITSEDYKHVQTIRNILLNQGWYSAPLIGVGPASIQQEPPAGPEEGEQGGKAHQAVDGFRKSTAGNAWPNLDRSTIADELDKRIDDPAIIKQSVLNVCGPAAIVYMLASQYPLRFVAMVQQLFEMGRVDVGGEILSAGTDLRKNTPPDVPSGGKMAQVDWMLMSSMRDSENRIFDFEGTAREDFSAITTPGDLIHWMKSILKCKDALWKSAYVSQEIEVIRMASDAVSSGKSVALLIDSGMLEGLPKEGKIGYPNHWVVLKSPVGFSETKATVEHTEQLHFSVWTWGESKFRDLNLDKDVFVKSFYGAAICTL